jgi:hypothetical protein
MLSSGGLRDDTKEWMKKIYCSLIGLLLSHGRCTIEKATVSKFDVALMLEVVNESPPRLAND